MGEHGYSWAHGHAAAVEYIRRIDAAKGIPPKYLVPEPIKATNRRVGRNDPCPCGSGCKFKACCLLHMGGQRRDPEQEKEYAEANELGIPVFDFRMRKRLGLVAPKVIPLGEQVTSEQPGGEAVEP